MLAAIVSRVGECSHRLLVGLIVVGALLATPWAWVSAAGVEHVVQSGENLTVIARRYGTDVKTLMELNDLGNPNLLRRGQRLLVSAAPVEPEPQVHVVKPGENLSSIAQRYGVSLRELAAWNGVRDLNKILPGQELVIAFEAVTHKVARGESLSVIATSYGVTVDSIALVNGLSNPDRLRVGQVLTIPPMGGGAVQALASSRSGGYRRTFDRWPAAGPVSSEYGPRGGRQHEGIDLAVPRGTPVRAVAAGRVSYADWAGSYGILVKIDHGGGLETRYAHNSRLEVEPGEYVAAGQIVARSGSTGNSTGPHIHFEVRLHDEPLNPRLWLP